MTPSIIPIFLLGGNLLPALVAASPRNLPHPTQSDITIPIALQGRAIPDSPSGDYAPSYVTCPENRPTIREASALSQAEAEWLTLRRNATAQPLRDFLAKANIPNFNLESYISSGRSAVPTISIAVSGGGYRALLNAAGFLSAVDARTRSANATGGIGGLLQATNYLAGLSGGGWLVGSMYANNFSSVEILQRGSPGSDLWAFQNSIFSGPDKEGISILNKAEYWLTIARDVAKKKDAGFETSITDYWGRALSYQLINATDGGPAYTFSSIAKSPDFLSANQPFPILVADGRNPGEKIVSLNSTVYEFNPFEMGSWDPTTYAFAPLKYLGSNFSSGTVPADGVCVQGFDQFGYVMGTSSSLFNAFLLQNITALGADYPKILTDAVTAILEDLSADNNDIAQYAPNPFLGFPSPDPNPARHAYELTLVDGGEDLQNIPLNPLTLPFRAVDVIFAVDSSADTDTHWPNGTALRATYDRSQTPIANATSFPPVPDVNTMINLGLNLRPTFFGCNASNFSSASPPPLIVYIPNAPYTALSNVSTFDPSYPASQRDEIIRNAYDGATQGNGTLDQSWPACVACAALSRGFSRTGTVPPAACVACFARYCWNGTLDQREVTSYQPGYIIGQGKTAESAGVTMRAVGGDGSSAMVVMMCVILMAVLLL
jgi:lysophospholipase